MKRALLTDRAWPDADIERAVLSRAGIELVEAPAGASERELVNRDHDMAAILTCWAPVTRQLIEQNEQLALIVRMGCRGGQHRSADG